MAGLSLLRHLNHAGEIWIPEGSRSGSDVGASSLKAQDICFHTINYLTNSGGSHRDLYCAVVATSTLLQAHKRFEQLIQRPPLRRTSNSHTYAFKGSRIKGLEKIKLIDQRALPFRLSTWAQISISADFAMSRLDLNFEGVIIRNN
ncbi:hypothetical protein PC119_g13557 [Phytophthora cactorum]|nr:hypothetical protein PC119_g13557 [Phytophthora cactorum]